MRTVRLSECICPIWGATEHGDPDYIGSSTLIQFGPKKFLVTSAHVLDYAERTTLYVPSPGELVPLVGVGKITPRVSGSRFNDKNDAAFLLLEPPFVQAIERLFFFLPPAFLDANDGFSTNTHYTFSGFPEVQTKIEHGRQALSMQRYTYTSVSIPKVDYPGLGIEPHSHIAIVYDTNGVRDEQGKKTAPVEPFGISGGPVFRGYWRDRTQQLADVKLVGICMENRQDSRALVGVRLNGVYESIRRAHPDVAPHIPLNPDIEIVINEVDGGRVASSSLVNGAG